MEAVLSIMKWNSFRADQIQVLEVLFLQKSNLYLGKFMSLFLLVMYFMSFNNDAFIPKLIGQRTSWGKTLIPVAIAIAIQYHLCGYGNKRQMLVLPTATLVDSTMAKMSTLGFSVVAPGYGHNKYLTTAEAFRQNASMIVLCPSRIVEYCGFSSVTGEEKVEDASTKLDRVNSLKSFDGGVVTYDEAHVYTITPFNANRILCAVINSFFPSVTMNGLTATTVAPLDVKSLLATLYMKVNLNY
jgi:hypothetical protein